MASKSVVAPSGGRLEAAGLALAYPGAKGPRTILDVRSFTVAAGETVALCGPSGSGKSSLLNLLSGIARPDAGSVHWDGVALSTQPARQRDRWRRENLGIVFQQFHLFARLSPLDNVLIAAHFDRLVVPTALRERARALLERIGVPPAVSVDRLSRGEMQRVALARALLLRPRVLIADEPTASLDPETAEAMGSLLIELCREHGTTALIATHDPALAARLDTAYVLDHGSLIRRNP